MPRLSDLAGAMTATRFQPIDRRGTYSAKWEKYAGRDVLPFWVADMDLATAPFVIAAVRERLEHPVLGYTATPTPVVAAFLDWLWRNYRWQVSEDWLVWFPGVVPGFNVAARALADQGEDLLIPAPVYPPFLRVPWQAGLRGVLSPLVRENGRWVMDFDDLAAKTSRATAAVLFCNPQNPTGRVYGREELNRLAELVVDNDTILISDEIHCPLVLDQDRQHIPIASLDAAIEARTVSLFAPTKAYNFPGLRRRGGGDSRRHDSRALRKGRQGATRRGVAAGLRGGDRGVRGPVDLAGGTEPLPCRQCGDIRAAPCRTSKAS